MKSINKKTTFFSLTIFLISSVMFGQAPLFAQTQTDYPKYPAQDMQDFKLVLKESVPALRNSGAFSTSLGLDWATPYMGPLINFPPNYGFAFNLEFVGVDLKSLNNLAKLFDKEGKEFFGGQSYFMMYLFEFRMGGFRSTRTDFGLKGGYWGNMVPDWDLSLQSIKIPVLMPSDFGYRNWMIGADGRINLNPKRDVWPEFTLGLEVSYGSGAFILEEISATFTEGNKFDKVDIEAGWEVLDIVFKADAAKTWAFFTVFGGGEIGYAPIKKTVVTLNNPDGIYSVPTWAGFSGPSTAMSAGSLSSSQVEAFGPNYSNLLGGSEGTATSDGVIVDFNGDYGFDNISFRVYAGLAFQLGDYCSLTAPLINYDVFAGSFAMTLSFKIYRAFWQN
jgi:hypothetical protein